MRDKTGGDGVIIFDDAARRQLATSCLIRSGHVGASREMCGSRRSFVLCDKVGAETSVDQTDSQVSYYESHGGMGCDISVSLNVIGKYWTDGLHGFHMGFAWQL